YHLYSGEETITRARSKLGEGGYNLAFNNCEHFAVWCKTGIKDSSQVNRILDMITYLLS
ncbi:MAG: lecithin retinol acyltransferase family protein, partial [Synergistaceae bacterium]|nr:lecithin retinol acyltransferase family protein [Synergistaceae bacterium]